MASQKTEDIGQLAREVGGQSTREVMEDLQTQEYPNKIAKDMGKSYQAVKYHIEKLREKGLVEKTGEASERKYFRLTSKGEKVLDSFQ